MLNYECRIIHNYPSHHFIVAPIKGRNHKMINENLFNAY